MDVEDHEEFDDTTLLPIVEDSTLEDDLVEEEKLWYDRLPRIKKREITINESGQKILLINKIQTRRVGKLRKRKQYSIETSVVQLEDSPFVQPELALRLEFEPVYGEDSIHVLARRSWWERGPSQMGLVALWLLVAGVLVYTATTTLRIPAGIVLAIFFLVSVAIGIVYFIIWMKWAYKYFVVTNRRIGLIYCPPFSLVGTRPLSPITNITVNEANDQSWFANLLGRINPSYSYGKLNYDTPAQADEWMSEITFIRGHKAINELVSSLIVQADQPIESQEQQGSRELQDMVNRRFLELHGEPQSE